MDYVEFEQVLWCAKIHLSFQMLPDTQNVISMLLLTICP